MDQPVIEMQGVSFSYNGQEAVSQASCRVEDGDFVSVVGPNGGGKTTLVKLIMGLIRPQQGWVKVFGGPPEKARRRMGYLPQRLESDPRFPVTVMEVVLMGCLGGPGWGRYGRAARMASAAALERMELADQAERPFASLSGGQRQRALIARALAGEPRLLILDEPTANVDPSMEQELFDLLSRLNQEMTIVVVSHDLGVVSSYVRKVICVNRQVRMHPTGQLDHDLITQLYGRDMRLVLHDRECHEPEAT